MELCDCQGNKSAKAHHPEVNVAVRMCAALHTVTNLPHARSLRTLRLEAEFRPQPLAEETQVRREQGALLVSCPWTRERILIQFELLSERGAQDLPNIVTDRESRGMPFMKRHHAPDQLNSRTALCPTTFLQSWTTPFTEEQINKVILYAQTLI